ncbi:type IV pilus secretin PilQ [Thiospirillum jenense]|uniref:Type IV pilus secretin PilQ n=1 Tax=Thiospirillum jenense TaxID=1653858 RepID=A0A839HHI3_9GAMM|nr:type IV pilus secretin PilQ [Thiospirillum jenense]MBB1125662.1 type IV pilus secretin PilQ [Thiospirillum jenense]
MNTSTLITTRFSNRSLVLLLVALLAIVNNSEAKTILKDVQFSALSGNAVTIDLLFSAPPPRPNDFSTDNPARIAIDLPGVESGLASKEVPISLGAAQSLLAIQVGDITRIIINLSNAVPYQLTPDGSRLTIALNPTKTPVEPAIVKESPPVAAIDNDVLPSPPKTTRFGMPAHAMPRAALKDIDFRRSNDGAGRVLITLPHPKTPINVREEGGKIVVDIANTQLPQRLFRRLDVVDFATPVLMVESRPVGSNIEISIETKPDRDYIAYQSDNLFTLEFRTLTSAEKEQLEREKVVYKGDRLSLNFQNIEVRAVLQLLADFTGLNLVASDTVNGNITLRLENVPWDQALDIVLKTKGLSMRQTGNVIMVAPTQEIAGQEKLELESKQQIEELAPLRSEFIQINYAKAAELAGLMKSKDNSLLSERGHVTVDTRTNTLLVQDTSIKLEEIRRLILRLDVPVRQVMIESRVVIADDNFARDLGVRFGMTGSVGKTGDNELLIGGGRPGYLDNTTTIDKGPFMGVYDTSFYQQPGGNGINAQNPLSPYNSSIEITNETNAVGQEGDGQEALLVNLPALTPSGAVNFLLGKVGSHLLQLELSAMQKEGRGEVVSAPRVVTSDQQQASIKLGQEIPYQVVKDGATHTEFKEAMLELNVTPHITPDDRVILEIQVNKDQADWSKVNVNDQNPPINRRSVETSVLIDNGETIVLGGIYEGEKSSSKEQVPWLGDLPFFGNLFKTTARKETNTELLIFVTPKILKGDLAKSLGGDR